MTCELEDIVGRSCVPFRKVYKRQIPSNLIMYANRCHCWPKFCYWLQSLFASPSRGNYVGSIKNGSIYNTTRVSLLQSFIQQRQSVLGFDTLLDSWSKFQQKSYLELSRHSFEASGNTYQFQQLEATEINTIESENVKAMLSIRFEDFSVGNRRRRASDLGWKLLAVLPTKQSSCIHTSRPQRLHDFRRACTDGVEPALLDG